MADETTTGEPIDFVLVLLREMRAENLTLRNDVVGWRNEMVEILTDMRVRMSSMEGHLAENGVQIAAMNRRMDRFDERLARVERRLDLVDA